MEVQGGAIHCRMDDGSNPRGVISQPLQFHEISVGERLVSGSEDRTGWSWDQVQLAFLGSWRRFRAGMNFLAYQACSINPDESGFSLLWADERAHENK